MGEKKKNEKIKKAEKTNKILPYLKTTNKDKE